MPDKKISDLDAAALPLSGAELMEVVKGGVTKRTSIASLADGISAPDTNTAFVFGRARLDARTADIAHFSHFDMAGVNEYALSHLDSGETRVNSTTNIIFAIVGAQKFNLTAVQLSATIVNGPSMMTESATSINPTLIPDRSFLGSGVSAGVADNQVSIVVNSIEAARWDINRNMICAAGVTIAGALDHDGSTAGFFATAPVNKPTGIAVSAAGIHAALVTLGLIAGP